MIKLIIRLYNNVIKVGKKIVTYKKSLNCLFEGLTN